MKIIMMKFSACVLLLLVFCSISFGQTTRNKKTKTATTSGYGTTVTPAAPVATPGNSGYGNAAIDTTKQPGTNSGYGDTTKPKTQFNNTLPIEVIKGSGNGLLDSVKMSLRNDAAVERNLVKERSPLAYEDLREDDAVYVVRVWREIDAREKINLPFRNAAVADNGSQRFISILLKAIQDGDVTAFSGDDDRFTTPITADDAFKVFAGGKDTSSKYDRDGNVIGYQVRDKAVDPDSIYKFRLKEEWVFDKESSRMFVRILGIAPVIPFKLSTDQIVENSERAVWWVYYPDMRPVFSKYEVFNGKNYGSKMTWEELFESRMFSSYITQSTIDNVYNLTLANVYPNNTLFRLLEGEKIKDKIFNYEQSLWEY